ncbi:MAG: NYN domain-containing protein [Planctomycetes bacterium]|nr:NYN domain-containing protein [Planctomycetota bacterium]MCW8136059.1 NYN domain-containing protein [Planctomycetota bacterium]
MYVVDGDNLLYATWKHPGLLPADRDRARARLIELLSALAQRESTSVRLFFDGTGGELRHGDLAPPKVRVHFAGPAKESADRAVREFVENHATPGKLLVVSADREVTNACKLAGAKIVASAELAQRLANLAPPQASRARPDKPTAGNLKSKVEREMLEDIYGDDELRSHIEDGL